MLDIGWSELLVIMVVLIVVVGPKDLPPMIRAFGKTIAGLRKMAGDFRAQFDEALKEADTDDVRQTISDIRNLNPTNSLQDAMNPLRQFGNEIRSKLQKVKTVDSSASTAKLNASEPVSPLVSVPEPAMSLPDVPPAVSLGAVPSVRIEAFAAPASAVAETEPKHSRAARGSEKSETIIEAEAVSFKPKRADTGAALALKTAALSKKASKKTATDKRVAPVPSVEPAKAAKKRVEKPEKKES